MFTLTIKTQNAAFKDDNDPSTDTAARNQEVARILRELAGEFQYCSRQTGGLYDANGNRVGKWAFDDE